MTGSRKRIDALLVDRGLAQSRERARRLVMAGRVLVDAVPVDKPGALVDVDAPVALRGQDIPFVSRGGLKLEKGLDVFGVPVADRVCMDIGASTGGFTDCLLQRGAARVYAVDVGYGQLAWKLRQHPRVVPIERTNIRTMPRTAVPEPVDLAVVDTSFISLRVVVPCVVPFLRPSGRLLALIKPQFEVGKGRVGKGGIVRSPDLHEAVIEDLSLFFRSLGLTVRGTTESPIQGAKGNREFIVCLEMPSNQYLDNSNR